MKYALIAVLAGLLGAVPAPAQHGSTYYQAHTFQGRYYPAGHYTQTGGCYYLNGQQCHGYASAADYHAKVVVQKVVVQEVPFYWSASPYQTPAAPAAAPADDLTKSLLLDAAADRRQAAAFQQQLILALLLKGNAGGAAVDPAALAVPAIPQAAPLRQSAPAKAGVEAFLERHCVACHGANGAKGNLDLSDLTKLSAERWADCWDAICDDTMPPAKKVPAAEKTAVKGEFRSRIFKR